MRSMQVMLWLRTTGPCLCPAGICVLSGRAGSFQFKRDCKKRTFKFRFGCFRFKMVIMLKYFLACLIKTGSKWHIMEPGIVG